MKNIKNKGGILVVTVLFLIGTIPVYSDMRDVSDRGLDTSRLDEERSGELAKEYDRLTDQRRNLRSNEDPIRENYYGAREKIKRYDELSEEDKIKYRGHIKRFLIHNLDRMDNHIDLVKKWIERLIDDEELINTLFNELDVKKEKISEFKDRVENATTIEELREIAQEIREFWRETRRDIKKPLGIIISHRAYDVIIKAEKMHDRLHKSLDALDQSDPKVQEMQALLDEFDDKIASALSKYNQARELYSDPENYDRVKELLRDAHEDLREAYSLLREVMMKYREYAGGYPGLENELDKNSKEEEVES